ncbi:hypothetical protein CoNPh26_CDS0005 [Staphylococcus phage S-CoN_Ph26]|nr:hypothetical protein CoNPh26_CDS0005 [Staphylococcus phage S-CoN_Ph26]
MLNDNLNYDNLLEFNKLWIPLSFKYLKENKLVLLGIRSTAYGYLHRDIKT